MSCYVVSEEQIDCLIATAINGPIDTEEANKLGRFHRLSFGQPRELLNPRTANKLGRLMLEANVKAVQIHDSNDERGDTSMYDQYKFPHSLVQVVKKHDLTVVQALKALQCFEYQCAALLDMPAFEGVSCEASLVATVKNVISDYRRNLIQVLPGYEEARWDLG